ncbi:unnamed protein product, partial [Prorocentrum cordatum]
RGAAKQSVAELSSQLQEEVGQDVGARGLQALAAAVGTPEPAQPAGAPLLEETVGAKGVACRRAEKALEHAVAQHDEAKRWLAECSRMTNYAAVLAVRAKAEWQAELKAELQKTRGAAPVSPPSRDAAQVPTGSQINLSQLLGDESGIDSVETVDGDMMKLSELEVGDDDRHKWLALKGSIAEEIQKAVLASIGPSADDIQRLGTEACDTRQRLSAKRTRKDEEGGTAASDAARRGSLMRLLLPLLAGCLPIQGPQPQQRRLLLKLGPVSRSLLQRWMQPEPSWPKGGSSAFRPLWEGGRQLMGRPPPGSRPQDDPDRGSREFVQSMGSWTSRWIGDLERGASRGIESWQ